ncbi:hypothetical protein A3860_08840 [Niastella vici]|uniref:NAD-dependent epimerase/dehydratase domain-containing protein n=1 Tax=Niastella vici TaxID=1703345 RepID=A0A1V9FHH6_9BACT|nr:NAD-dependent epimerase/dehydratase family protein [Niastella vici]OQP57727.1 hypothetical protein A3860_08840 [Niastella vici]
MQLTPNQSEKIAGSSFLITGGAGFIGSHLAECLLTDGASKVRVLDNFSTGRFGNLAPFANHPQFGYTDGDIRDVHTCKKACEGIDYVFHYAATRSANDPVTINNVNTPGFLNMLGVAHDAKVKRFVYASDFFCNGSKDINELYAGQFASLYGMETIGLRYSNVFGQRHDPRSGYAAIIPTFVMQLMRHESPVINGAGAYVHDFNYVENVVQANLLAVLTNNPAAVNQVYDITFEEKYSLPQLALCLKELLSVFDARIAAVDLAHEPGPEQDALPEAVAEKAKELLGYHPCYSLRQGLLQSASWYWTYLPIFQEEAVEKKRWNAEVANEQLLIRN